VPFIVVSACVIDRTALLIEHTSQRKTMSSNSQPQISQRLNRIVSIIYAICTACLCATGATISAHAQEDIKLGIGTYDNWPALIIKTTRTTGEFSQDGKKTVLPAYMAIMCKSPGIVPKVALFGDTTVGRKETPLPFAIQSMSTIDMQINDEPWQKVSLIEKFNADYDANNNLLVRSDNGMKLPGGLILVDRIAKANNVRVKWRVDDSVNFFGEFSTQFETRANPDYANFLKKKCGVLGLK
jgi:hypothetical protein